MMVATAPLRYLGYKLSLLLGVRDYLKKTYAVSDAAVDMVVACAQKKRLSMMLKAPSTLPGFRAMTPDQFKSSDKAELVKSIADSIKGPLNAFGGAKENVLTEEPAKKKMKLV